MCQHQTFVLQLLQKVSCVWFQLMHIQHSKDFVKDHVLFFRKLGGKNMINNSHFNQH